MTAMMGVALIGAGSAVALCAVLARSVHYITTGRWFR
jgi:hypothetical protein